MGKVSPNDRQSKNGKQKKRSKNSNNKYLKPGALAQLRKSRASGSKSCTDLSKKRVVVSNAVHTEHDNPEILDNENKSPVPSTPVKFEFAPVLGPTDVFSQNNLQNTPKTPRAEECDYDSRLESLPIDLLVLSIFSLLAITYCFLFSFGVIVWCLF